MPDITIIFTAHREIGQCNSRELLRIIENFTPEVIFEEISPKVFDQCYGVENRFTLETNAIKIYLEKHDVIHIPVVTKELADVVNKKFEVLVKNQDYCYLIDNLFALEENNGFSFLNSNKSDVIFDNLKSHEDLILLHSKDDDLKTLFESANRNIDQYENEILENVYEFHSQNNFDKALLFMGTAHKKSVKRKLEEYDQHLDVKLNWSFYNET